MLQPKRTKYRKVQKGRNRGLASRGSNVDGMKTGWTDAAGYCLVASAEREGMRLISVVMGTASEEARAIETQKLLTYGFRYFETHKLYDANQVLTSLPVYAGERDSVDLAIKEEVYVTIPRGQAEAMTATVDVDEIIQAPVQEGQVMGVVNVMLENEMIHSGDVVAVQEVAEGGAFKRFVDWINWMFNDSFSE